MTTLHELVEVPLHEVTLRVQAAETPEEKAHEFGEWILKVNGIDGVHGLDAVNEVVHLEFGPEISLTAMELIRFQRTYGHTYRIEKNGDTLTTAA